MSAIVPTFQITTENKLAAAAKRAFLETTRTAREAVDWATTRFLISGRAGSKPGRRFRRQRIAGATPDHPRQSYYLIHKQPPRRPHRVWIPPTGETSMDGQSRAQVIARSRPIKTHAAGRGSWHGAMRDLATRYNKMQVPRSTHRFRHQITDTRHAETPQVVSNTVRSRLSYLRKVWPNLSSAAMHRAAMAMTAILDKRGKNEIQKEWSGK